MTLTGRRVATIILAGILALPAFHAWRVRRQPIDEPDRNSVEWRTRQDVLSRAKVLAYPSVDVSRVDFSKTPHDSKPLGLDGRLVECRYLPKPTKANTPKFDCELPGGEVVKVKYDTLEIQAELAGTRLLAGLGFGADHISLVQRLRCYGCPARPFQTRRMFEYFFAGAVLDWFSDPKTFHEFEWVAVERRIHGRPFELEGFSGWHFNEIGEVDPEKGGASDNEIDAFRLVALLLGHWDNKLDNQRIVCRDDASRKASDRPCLDPLLIIHDAGATFGQRRVDLPTWRAQKIWADGPGCKGSEFFPAEITEAGRQFTVARLRQISVAQLTALFTGARFPDPLTGLVPATDVSPWVQAFLDKVSEIADRPPCPRHAEARR